MPAGVSLGTATCTWLCVASVGSAMMVRGMPAVVEPVGVMVTEVTGLSVRSSVEPYTVTTVVMPLYTTGGSAKKMMGPVSTMTPGLAHVEKQPSRLVTV